MGENEHGEFNSWNVIDLVCCGWQWGDRCQPLLLYSYYTQTHEGTHTHTHTVKSSDRDGTYKQTSLLTLWTTVGTSRLLWTCVPNGTPFDIWDSSSELNYTLVCWALQWAKTLHLQNMFTNHSVCLLVSLEIISKLRVQDEWKLWVMQSVSSHGWVPNDTIFSI